MTFADRLEELRKAATGTPWTREGHSRIPEISMNGIRSSADADYIAFLANNADAILELVRAADKLMRLYKKSVDVGPHNNPNTEANICRCINEVLAKLNGEQT